jgi:secondary thiamine-phosphate synthase enzyme
MKFATKKITISTRGFNDIIDITSDIEDFVDKTGVEEGQVTVFVQGSTGAISVIEYEPNLEKDFENVMEKLVPSNVTYEHKKTWNDDNGFSHIRASIIGCSETIIITGGQLMLGTWQQVILIDFDTSPRNRKVFLSIVGK